MTSRFQSEENRRKYQLTKRAGPSRNVFDFRYWVSSWAHPFESSWSVYEKYAWINDALPHEHLILTSAWPKAEHRSLDDRLFSAVQEQHRAPHIQLWNATQFAKAVCPDCLDAGYWSELPQIAGYDQCPLHGIPLQRQCRKCQQLIWFGYPQFAETGAFVCQSCGEPLTSFPTNVFLQWKKISPDSMASKFGPLNAVAHNLAVECLGYWRFPGPDSAAEERLILHLLTRHHERLDHDRNWPMLVGEVAEQVTSVSFQLPCDVITLAAELEYERRTLITDLIRHCHRRSIVNHHVSGVQIVNIGGITHDLDFRTGGNFLENVMSVFNFLSQGRQKKKHWSYEEHLRSEIETYFSSEPYIKQVPKILLTFSVWQICRVLMRVEFIVTLLMEQLIDSDGMNDRAYTIMDSQPYGIRLKWGRVGEGHFVFELDSSAWIPPYRLRNTASGGELTVFPIFPLFDK